MLSVRFARTGIAHDVVVKADPGGERRLTLAVPGSEALPPLAVLDAAAIAALPLAVRAVLALHVVGPVSHGAMRDLTEMVDAWAHGGRHGLAAVPITAESIVTGLAPHPATPPSSPGRMIFPPPPCSPPMPRGRCRAASPCMRRLG